MTESIVNFNDKKELLMYALKVFRQVEVLSDLKKEDKAEFIVAAIKKAINSSPLTDDEKYVALSWCDVVLPYVVEAIDLVKKELDQLKTVVVADLKKCCKFF